MMEIEEKYNKLINILKASKPMLKEEENIEDNVIRLVSETNKRSFVYTDIINILFGWAYIGWVRRSLAVLSVVLVMIFVYQQCVIMRQIDYLGRQTMVIKGESQILPNDDIEGRLLMNKLQLIKYSSHGITISEKELMQLIESFNDLQIKYKDLQHIIDEDPYLKQYIERKLRENNHLKINL